MVPVVWHNLLLLMLNKLTWNFNIILMTKLLKSLLGCTSSYHKVEQQSRKQPRSVKFM